MKTAKANTKEATGAVVRYTSNKHQDIDGLVLDQGGKLTDIKFPPHTGRFVREVARKGDTVEVTLHEKPREKPHPPNPDHHKHPKDPKSKLELVSIANTGTGKQFVVDTVKPPHAPESGQQESFTIPNPQYTRGGKHDEITGVIFEDKYFHLHPKEYEEGEEGLESAKLLHIKAKKRKEDAGFVNEGGYTVYHTHAIHIDQPQTT